jgi:hypothetical protein
MDPDCLSTLSHRSCAFTVPVNTRGANDAVHAITKGCKRLCTHPEPQNRHALTRVWQVTTSAKTSDDSDLFQSGFIDSRLEERVLSEPQVVA